MANIIAFVKQANLTYFKVKLGD